MALSEKTKTFIAREDEKLNRAAGWPADDLSRTTETLLTSGRVEVGYRASCGSTDRTMKIWRAWMGIVKRLRADGFAISETPVKHGNAYATTKGGFWQSAIFESAAVVKQSLTTDQEAQQ